MKHARALLTLAGCATLIAVPALAQNATTFDAPFAVAQGDMALHWEITGEFRGRVHATR